MENGLQNMHVDSGAERVNARECLKDARARREDSLPLRLL